MLSRLEEIAQTKECSSSDVIREVVEDYLRATDWIEQKVTTSLEASKAGQSKSHEDVKTMVRGMGFHVD
jgi:predicted transcriptional regulator